MWMGHGQDPFSGKIFYDIQRSLFLNTKLIIKDKNTNEKLYLRKKCNLCT